MRLPDTAESFVDSVYANSKLLIERAFWEIPMPRIESWFRQFCGPEERFFAACLLDQVIFRTRQQFEAALRSLFRSNLYGNLYPGAQDLQLLEMLKGRTDPKVRLVPVICETDAPTKSGPLVLRRLQRILLLNAKWMCWPWQAVKAVEEGSVETILFVDDFLGSGGQFEGFFRQWHFDKHLDSGVSHFYAPVVAHQKGIDHLTKELPRVCVVSAETLGPSHDFFSTAVWERIGHNGCVTADDAKSWYLDFGKKRRLFMRFGRLKIYVQGGAHSDRILGCYSVRIWPDAPPSELAGRCQVLRGSTRTALAGGSALPALCLTRSDPARS